jgi:hypothetical protein
MNFEWSEYLDLARDLTRNFPNRQAALRCAISRAYYAAHCTARNYLRDQDPRSVRLGLKGADHQVVIDALANSPDGTRAAIGIKLRRLRSDRVLADYYDDTGPLGSTNGQLGKKAEQVIATAQQIIDAVSVLSVQSS